MRMTSPLLTDDPAAGPLGTRGRTIRLRLSSEPDNVIKSLQSGFPLSWHQQRCDALVPTTNGIAFYGQVDRQPAAISADARVSLGALGTKPLGLCAYGDLVCTLSNPSILMDLSETGTAVIMALLYVDGSTMLNAMRIVRVQAGRHTKSAPVDHMCFAFCTNEGVLASKFYAHEVLRRHLQALRTCRKNRSTPPREPTSQLVVWHSGEEPINDFVLRLRHPERNVADVVLCYDANKIDVCTAQFRSLGGSLQVIFVRHQRIAIGSEAANTLRPHHHAPSMPSSHPLPLPSSGHFAHPPGDFDHDSTSMVPSLSKMTSFFTYLAFNTTGSILVATADVDKLIVVFGASEAYAPNKDAGPHYAVRFVYAVATESSERPYKVVHVGGDVFVVACQHVVIGVDAFSGASTVLHCAGPHEIICGLCTKGHGAVYVGLMWLQTNETALPERRVLRVEVAASTGPLPMRVDNALAGTNGSTTLQISVEEDYRRSTEMDQRDAMVTAGAHAAIPEASLKEWCSAWLHAAVAAPKSDATSRCLATPGFRETLYVAGKHLCRQSHPLIECGGGGIAPASSADSPSVQQTDIDVRCSSCGALVNLMPYLVCPVCNEVLCEGCFVTPASLSLPSS